MYGWLLISFLLDFKQLVSSKIDFIPCLWFVCFLNTGTEELTSLPKYGIYRYINKKITLHSFEVETILTVNDKDIFLSKFLWMLLKRYTLCYIYIYI